MSEFNNTDDYEYNHEEEGEELADLTEIVVENDEVLSIDDDDAEEEVIDDIHIDDDNNVNNSIPDLSHYSFENHKDSVYCVAIHPTIPGIVITGGGDDVAYIWNYHKSITDSNIETVNNGSTSSSIKLEGHIDTVTCVGFNFNGNLALTGGYDGFVKIWKVDTGELVQTLEGPEDIEWAQWHMKGNAIVAGSRDGTIWMWLAHNGQCVHVFAGKCIILLYIC